MGPLGVKRMCFHHPGTSALLGKEGYLVVSGSHSKLVTVRAKDSCLCTVPRLEPERQPLRVACRRPAVAFADMLRSASCARRWGPRAPSRSPVPTPACKCVLRDTVQCSGGPVARPALLGLPANLTHILLFRMGPGTLRNDSFGSMTVMQRVILTDSPMASTAPGAFHDLIKLKTLRLSRNGITHLPATLVDKVVLLEQLFLDRNELKDIDQNMFGKLVDLPELFLNPNQLAVLPARLLSRLGNLRLRDVSANNPPHLPRGMLAAQARREKLALHSNRLEALGTGLLSPLRASKELPLHGNHLRSIAPGALDTLWNLSSLTLSRNRLEFLPPTSHPPSTALFFIRVICPS